MCACLTIIKQCWKQGLLLAPAVGRGTIAGQRDNTQMISYCIELIGNRIDFIVAVSFDMVFGGIDVLHSELFLKKESLPSPVMIQHTFEFYYNGYSGLTTVYYFFLN